MKRLIKLLLNLVLALMAVAVTLLIVFFMTPSWQKRLVEDALAQDRERQWQVGTVRIQPFGLEVESLYVLDGSIGAGIDFLQASTPLWKLLLFGELEIESGSIIGLEMDLSKIKVGDLTSEDYQAFLDRVSNDPDFWEERIGLLLSKAAVQGFRISIRDMPISGKLLMPGNKLVPVRWTIVQADSAAPRLITVQRYMEPERML
ncbi:MAG TPA: hypothetical protein VK995_04745 [Oceanipulchritudo sp.]|nr:hypothetical protein [Oceanipulchritudo sp.]